MKKLKGFNFKNFVITIVCGFAACELLGLIFFRASVFVVSSNRFAFTAYGITGALVFAAMLYRNIKESLLILVIMLLLNIIIADIHIISFIIRDIVVFSCLWLSLYIYKNFFYNSLEKYKYLRAIGLGITMAILFFVAGIFLLFINVPLERISIELIIQVSSLYLQSGMLIGLGLGLGFDIAELLKNKNSVIEF